ncbi:hypothetical protein DXG03_009683 [Asterophora parasitica]|uniref:Chitin synthase n=1 Tax=Asterophora parasitica TaxID=117018 RepID=A0A9P7G4K6_9AGAR|nr:hypothetical protein DXG03_009683 [Asterophora parasitica]
MDILSPQLQQERLGSSIFDDHSLHAAHESQSLLHDRSEDEGGSDDDLASGARMPFIDSSEVAEKTESIGQGNGTGSAPPPVEEQAVPTSSVFDDLLGLGTLLLPFGLSLLAGHIPEREPLKTKPVLKTLTAEGNYVVDLDVPTEVRGVSTLVDEHHYSKYMRYSAVTCEPDDFAASGFSLRQVEMKRTTELFIAITMYNEDEELFSRTLNGVLKNIAYLCKRKDDPKWGKGSWKKVVVCIISDGRRKINPGTLAAIAKIGAYQEKTAIQKVREKDVVAHVYEYTSRIPFSAVLPSVMTQDAVKSIPPVQIIFCLKENNQKKINSHRWFFNAFGSVLKPNVCVLLDVGTMPGPTSLYHLWNAFDINENVGGACGEIVAFKGQYGEDLLNPLVAAQNFEYKMSNILDKPVESVLGYITVLPGAFSAYRYIALLNDEVGEGPLQKYFLGDLSPTAKPDLFAANMYLAEDRLPELISQRRRWLNGSFAAGVYAIMNFRFIYRSSHTFARKFWIHFEMLYQLYNLIFSWFALGNYYIGFVILSTSLEHLVPAFKYPNVVLNYLYLGLVIMSFLLSLGNRPQGSRYGYVIVFFGFAFLMMYMTAASFTVALHGIRKADKGVPKDIIISIVSSLGLYFLSSMIALDPWHTFTSFLQYLLISPAYISVLNVYAVRFLSFSVPLDTLTYLLGRQFANIHDVSWGTKADDGPKEDPVVEAVRNKKNENSVEVPMLANQDEINKGYEDAKRMHNAAKEMSKLPSAKPAPNLQVQNEDFFRSIRTYVMLFWSLSNALLAATVT